ncbi:hypothetical protein VPHF35G1_0085 [Vibrio phage F35 g1]|nr:putative coil containing protein [Vibrio phage 115E34-1]
MTTYNTYQEAKIANPESEIYKLASGYIATKEPQGISVHKCNPADHCMTVEEFLADGYKFELGDVCLDGYGEVVNIDVECHIWDKPDDRDSSRYILRAAALESIPTETPEEKEVLDVIESAGEVGWKNGDAVYLSNPEGFALTYGHDDMDKVHECVALLSSENAMVVRCGFGLGVFSLKMCSKPETPQNREDRERLEAAYDLYCYVIDKETTFDSFCNFGPLKDIYIKIVDKTNYRKQD